VQDDDTLTPQRPPLGVDRPLDCGVVDAEAAQLAAPGDTRLPLGDLGKAFGHPGQCGIHATTVASRRAGRRLPQHFCGRARLAADLSADGAHPRPSTPRIG
jgi:hypothetical protein